MDGWRPANTSSTNVCVWLFTFCHVADSCCDIAYTTYIVAPFKEGTMSLCLCLLQ